MKKHLTHHHACDCREETFKRLLEAGKVLFENSTHAPLCPIKYGHACNCGFDEMCKNWIKAEGDAEAEQKP